MRRLFVSRRHDCLVHRAILGLLLTRKQLTEQIDDLIKKNGDRSGESVPENVSASEDELEFLQSLDEVYAQQQARLEQRQELQAEKKKADEDLASLRKFGPTEHKPI